MYRSLCIAVLVLLVAGSFVDAHKWGRSRRPVDKKVMAEFDQQMKVRRSTLDTSFTVDPANVLNAIANDTGVAAKQLCSAIPLIYTATAGHTGANRNLDKSYFENVFTGDIDGVSDPGYNNLRTGFQIQRVNVPAAIFTPHDVESAACALGVAEFNGKTVSALSGGHDLSSHFSGQWESVVINMDRFKYIQWLDKPNNIIRAGTGVRLYDLHVFAHADGVNRLFPSGDCADVHLGGHITGGGWGENQRKYGMALDNVVGMSVLLADGRVVRASTTENPDLFWAMLGAGASNFGIAIDFDLQLHTYPYVYVLEQVFDATYHAQIQRTVRDRTFNIESVYNRNASYYQSIDAMIVMTYFRTDGWYYPINNIIDVEVYCTDTLQRCRDYSNFLSTFPGYLDTWTNKTDGTHNWVDWLSGFVNPLAVGSTVYPPMLSPQQTTDSVLSHVHNFASSVDVTKLGFDGYFGVIYEPCTGACSNKKRNATAYVHRTENTQGDWTLAVVSTFNDVNNWDYLEQQTEHLGRWLLNRGEGEVYQNYRRLELMDLPREQWKDLFYRENLQRAKDVKNLWNPTKLIGLPMSL